MKKPIFTGSGVAIITPFAKDGSIDFEELGKLLEFQIENETDAIIICGTTGESAAMPDSEHLSVIDYAVKKVNGRIPVIAGTGSNDTAHGITLCKAAEKLGVDGLLTVTPYYNKTTQRGLVKHFTALANSVKIPLILYNVPSRTGLNIKPDTLLELSKVENIIGIKEASGNITQLRRWRQNAPIWLFIRQRRPDYPHYVGGQDWALFRCLQTSSRKKRTICAKNSSTKTPRAL